MCTTVRIATPVTRTDERTRGSKFARVLLAGCTLGALAASAQSPAPATADPGTLQLSPRPSGYSVRTVFAVKYVAEGAVYLNAGRNAGLATGMKLVVKRAAAVAPQSGSGEASGSWIVGRLEVISVADTSAVCEIKSAESNVQPGDAAFLSTEDAEVLAQKQETGSARKYPQMIAFTEGTDPLEEELREEVPKPPPAEVNRARGRIGLDYSGTRSGGSAVSSNSQVGVVVRADITRIGGSYWNLSGYWRGRLTHQASGDQTLQDLLNRTYHLSMTYDNPTSHWVAGFGRLYLPWAPGLDTLDGGYGGRRIGKAVTVGLFAGSTPDPTSWNYNPDRRIAGTFVAAEGGSFDGWRVTSTSGMALSTTGWRLDRPFVFFENGIFYKRYFSVYHSLQADSPRPVPGSAAAGAGVSRSYLTLRVQPHERFSFDISHTYFRDVPTFDTRLIGTGLLDKYLFQGISAGVRAEVVRNVTVYSSIGRSDRTGDTATSWNQMYGVTWARIWHTGFRADARYSKFSSAFGAGNYRALSVSRNFGEALRWELQAGRQTFSSTLTTQTASRFVNSSLDAAIGGNYFLQGGYTVERGNQFDYDQWFLTFGYRFDNRGQKR